MTVLALALGVAYVLVAFLALAKPGRRAGLGRGLGLYSLLAAGWMASQAAWEQEWLPELWPGFSARLPLYGLLLLSIFFSAWVKVYLERKQAAVTWLGILATSVLVGIDANPLHLPDVLWSNGQTQVLRNDFILAAIAILWGFFMASATLASLAAMRQASQPFFRNRVKYLAPVLLLVVGGHIAFMARYWSIGSILHLLGLLLAAYAVLSERLPSLRRASARAVSYLLTSGIAVAFFGGVFWLVQSARLVVGETAGGLPVWLLDGGLAAVLVFLVLPVLNRLLAAINRRVAGASKEPTQMLRQYSQGISNILDIRLLAVTVIGMIEESLGAQKGELFLVDLEKQAGGNAYQFRSVMPRENSQPLIFSLAEDHPAAIQFGGQRSALSRHELQTLPGYPAQADDPLSRPDFDIYLPIFAKEAWIGLLALGPKASGEPYWDDERFVLSALADQTAVALENARLVESLMRLNNEFRRAIEALNQANRNLEHLDNVKSDFISIASHELLTPLTVLSGYGQMLAEDKDLNSNPRYNTMISGIHNGAQRLNEIVEGMLDLAKIDSHELQLDPQPVSLDGLIRSIYDELQPTLDKRQQMLDHRRLSGLPSVEADAEALRKVFSHLLVNASKYTPDGGRIIVSGRAIPPLSTEFPRGGVQVTVADTGVGIDLAVQELIFTKFFQTGELAKHSSGKSKFKGAGPGLGLAITRGIVEAHGGRVWVESPGYDETACPGSQFHVLLPLYQERKDTLKISVNA